MERRITSQRHSRQIRWPYDISSDFHLILLDIISKVTSLFEILKIFTTAHNPRNLHKYKHYSNIR